MQDTIDQILDLTTKFLISEYNFTEVFPSLRFIKADQAYKDIGGNDYRGVQIIITGEFQQDGVVYNVPEVALLVNADVRYEVALQRALKEMQEPGENTRWSIEYLIIKPCIKNAKQVELV
jgi:hypothetical protein